MLTCMATVAKDVKEVIFSTKIFFFTLCCKLLCHFNNNMFSSFHRELVFHFKEWNCFHCHSAMVPNTRTHTHTYKGTRKNFMGKKFNLNLLSIFGLFLHVLNWLNLAMCCLCKDQFEAYCSVFRADYIFKKWWKKSICFSWRHINFIYDKTFSIGFEFYSQFFFLILFYCCFMCFIGICKVLRVESICGCKATQSFFHFCGDSRMKKIKRTHTYTHIDLQFHGWILHEKRWLKWTRKNLLIDSNIWFMLVNIDISKNNGRKLASKMKWITQRKEHMVRKNQGKSSYIQAVMMN